MRERRFRQQGDPTYMDKLRKKFMKQAKKYYGVPYAKKYWKPERKLISIIIILKD